MMMMMVKLERRWVGSSPRKSATPLSSFNKSIFPYDSRGVALQFVGSAAAACVIQCDCGAYCLPASHDDADDL